MDTPGAYPGLGAEERGQAEAIAVNLREMATFEVPIVTIVIGEGGSGGALAIAVADRVLMFENSVYSVISPEGCASILWRDGKQGAKAAEALRLAAPDLQALGHRGRGAAGAGRRGAPRLGRRGRDALSAALRENLDALSGVSPEGAGAPARRAVPPHRGLLGAARLDPRNFALLDSPRSPAVQDRGATLPETLVTRRGRRAPRRTFPPGVRTELPRSAMALSAELLAILVCPACKGDLVYDAAAPDAHLRRPAGCATRSWTTSR